MKAQLMNVLWIVVGVIVALVIYNKFLVSIIGSFEGSNNFEVDNDGQIMKVA